jgi:peptidoglycan/xylan/chitin deacetylase (PgdA/CDA1 family)
MRRSLILTTLAFALLGVLAATALARDTAPADHGSLTLVLAHTLRFGDEGQAVATLQRMLRAGGYDPGKIDGIFGPLTEAAVRRAQAALHLEEDGLVGRLTAAALQESLAAAGDAGATAAGADAAPAVVPALSGAAASEPKVPSATLVVHQAVAAAPPVARVTSAAPSLASLPDTAAGAAQAAQVVKSGLDKPFALTFNGDPDPKLLPSLLAALKQYNMHATFFVYGQTAERSPDLIAQIAAAGHEVAVGGYSATDLTGVAPAEAGKQLQKARDLIAAAAGQAPAHFRPPFGRVDNQVVTAAAGVGLRVAMWTNVTVQDAPGSDAADLADRLAGVVYPGAVVMLHQDRVGTVAALEPLLAELQASGYSSTTLNQLDK